MEPASLAVGIVALATTFNNAVDCFEYVQLGRAFGNDFQTSLIRLGNERLRVSRWGQAVGLSGDIKNASNVMLATAPPEDVTAANKVLKQILGLFAEAERVSAKYTNRTGEADQSLATLDSATDMDPVGQSLVAQMRTLSINRQNKTPLTRKAKWALYEKKQFNELIQDIANLVKDLVQLFPAAHEERRRLCRSEVSEIKSSDARLALKDVAALEDKELEEAIVEASESEDHKSPTFNNHDSRVGMQAGVINNSGTQAFNF
ncbi:uncharacterized protein J4E87_008386 [Alternaria ethzedia]|uniref:uncharacterized protein n=1 Tax=Alternaria ethzedia TaxID=181014 RepID=UPI0020C4080C|nr:uncharacterized protein J4E87_008386 [Alternaria ethzedia]KAI4617146.1 hypothetical protein J4E87_008386 [Alternaria ethzedia]